jgi:excisionase family DNA binding protein
VASCSFIVQRIDPTRASVLGKEASKIMRIITGLLIVALAILMAVGGLVLVQRLYSIDRRKQHNDVAGFIYAVLGVAYAVLLGLMLIAVWGKWEAAEYLGLTPTTVQEMVERGVLKAEKLAGAIHIPREEVECIERESAP